MMPLFEYLCDECMLRVEEIRTIARRHDPKECHNCGGEMYKIVSVPQMLVWEAGRHFPNLSPKGDGSMTFDSKHEYEMHLKEHGIYEDGIRGTVRTPHGATVTKYG